MKYILLLLITLLVKPIDSTAQATNVQDSLALVDLYNSTNGPNWSNNSTWLKGPVTKWKGVYLDSNGRVFRLDLRNTLLTGSLPNSIGDLTGLAYMNFEFNRLSNQIPNSIGNLTNLEFIDLSSNQLSGAIPFTIGNLINLKTLYLGANPLESEIPETIGNLVNLTDLFLSDANLSGSIPNSIGNLTKITSLYLSDNKLSGELPYNIGNLAKIKFLNLSFNRLSGKIPSTISNLTNAFVVDLSDNQYTTFDDFEKLVSLIHLSYAFQATIQIHQHTNLLSVPVGGTLINNTYRWQSIKDGKSYIKVGDSTFTPPQFGEYTVSVSNNIATSLVFYSDTFDFKTSTPLNIFAINPNPNLIDSSGQIKVDLSTLPLESNVVGAATDGVTKILLVCEADTSISFSIDINSNGSLSTLENQNESSAELTVQPQNGRVGVIYTVPDGYGNNVPERYVMIHVKSNNGDTSSINLKLFTPPVVLVHGMWSKPAVWDEGGFTDNLQSRGISNLYKADYSQFSSLTFDPLSNESVFGRSAIQEKIDEALYDFKNQKIAVTQVDIVGHSLGGLMARSLAQQPLFKIDENYYKGFIHKLITLGTPHGGSPLGPELYNMQNEIGAIYINPILTLEPIVVSGLLYLAHKPIGSCHKDFAFRSTGLSHLTETPHFKTFSITGDYRGDGDIEGETIGYSAMEALSLIVFHKTFESVMESRCHNFTLPNDLIVPYKSQTGYIDKTALYYGTAHSFPGTNTETNSPIIQDKVAELLLSNDSTEFDSKFPAPTDYDSVNCDNQNEIIGSDLPFKKKETSNDIEGANKPTGNEYVQISSPIRGNVYHEGVDTVIAFSFEPHGGAMPTTALFMIEDGGWFAAPTTEPYSVTVGLPKNIRAGQINIILMARDTTGILMFDTSHITFLPVGTLDSILVTPSSIRLDSSIRQSNLLVQGKYTISTSTQTLDISEASAGTVYTTQKNAVVANVSNNGVVTAVNVGTDTILVSNSNRILKIPVTVDSSFLYKTLYQNTIDFTDIPNKQSGDAPFALDATATSGETVNFTLLSGPVELINGVVIIKGTGAVTIQATSSGNAYFDSAAPVTKTFYIGSVLPLQLLSFTGSLISSNVLLNWTTANELNMSYYVVERSIDGVHFLDLSTVNVANNSSGAGNYYFKDQDVNILSSSNVYYRLKEVDKDGKITLSNTIPITLNNVKKIVVYPNPAKGAIHLLLNQPLDGDSYLKMYDMTGKEVTNRKLIKGLSQQVYLPAVSSGNYKIVIWSNGKIVHQQMLLVSM